MRLLNKLEQHRTSWTLLLTSLLFFLLRFPSLLEPYWYGDEGIYQAMGIAINHGRILYAQVWDNKPPLLYLIYALFNGDQFSVRLASLVFGIAAAIVFYFLTRMLFENRKLSLWLTLLFTVLFASPLFEGNIANAENFILFPVISAIYLAYRTISSGSFSRNKRTGFFIGLILGVSFLLKIVAIFDLCTVIFFLGIVVSNRQKAHASNRLTLLDKAGLDEIATLLLGFVIPFIISVIYFVSHQALPAYIQSAFFGNIGYVGYQNTFLGIPQGFLLLKTIILAATLIFLVRYRKRIALPHLFIYTWMIFSLYNAYFSQRPYTHYVLVVLPSLCIFIGLVITTANNRIRAVHAGILIAILLAVGFSFDFYSVGKTMFYYQNMFAFITRQKSLNDYQAYFDAKTPRDYAVANYIDRSIPQDKSVYIWGDSAQIYALAHRVPPIRYTVAYHTMTNEKTLQETQAAIDNVQPNYIITLSEAPPFPLHAQNYAGKYTLKGAAIYERTF